MIPSVSARSNGTKTDQNALQHARNTSENLIFLTPRRQQVFADAVGGKVGPGGMSRNAYLLQYVRKDAVPSLLHAGDAGLPLDPSRMCEEGGR